MIKEYYWRLPQDSYNISIRNSSGAGRGGWVLDEERRERFCWTESKIVRIKPGMDSNNAFGYNFWGR